MKSLAPFANPAQYPGGYPGKPGNLSRLLSREGEGDGCKIISGAPYGVRRNFENNLNPQTKLYVERSVENTLHGKAHQWWRASDYLALR